MSVVLEHDRFLTPAETAELIGLDVDTLAGWRSNRPPRGVQLPYVKIGGRVKYRLSAIERWLEERTVAASE